MMTVGNNALELNRYGLFLVETSWNHRLAIEVADILLQPNRFRVAMARLLEEYRTGDGNFSDRYN